MTHERWQTTVRQVDGEGGRELPSKQTVLLVLAVLMVKMRMQGRSRAAYSHHPSLGYPFLPAPYFPIAEHLPASPRGSCTQPARKPGREHSTPSLEHPHHGQPSEETRTAQPHPTAPLPSAGHPRRSRSPGIPGTRERASTTDN